LNRPMQMERNHLIGRTLSTTFFKLNIS